MSNDLSNELKAQLFAQESNDPFLALITLTHPTFTARLVNNSSDITSRSLVYTALPMTVRLPVDDGESARDVEIAFDNVTRELIQSFRSVTTEIGVKIEMVLASMPDIVQISFEDLVIRTISYDAKKISARLVLDSFLGVEVTSERYTPALYPGMF
jgi:hypothetical protein